MIPALVLFSLVVFTASLVGAPWMLLRLPADYFTRPGARPLQSLIHRPTLRSSLLILKNVIGGLLLISGIAMLVLPGQGLLTILVAMEFLDFPGKFALKRWLISRPLLSRPINRFRVRHGRAAFELSTKLHGHSTDRL